MRVSMTVGQMTLGRFTLGLAAAAFLAVAASATPAAAQAEQRLAATLTQLGYPDGKLPDLKPPFGNYVDAVQSGKLLFLSSAGPQTPKGEFLKGRVPDQVSVEQAITASQLACVRQIARIKAAVGDLDKVAKVVFMRGKILAQEGFADHSKIVDACSAMLVLAFGEAGKHARTSDGMTSLPFSLTTEIELTVELK